MDEALAAALRGELLLLLLSRPEKDAFGVATIPRVSTPWVTPEMGKIKWHMRDGHLLSHFFDFDMYCHLRILGVAGLMYRVAPVVSRPRPAIPLDQLEMRYRDIERTPGALRELDIVDDLTTWPVGARVNLTRLLVFH